MNQTIFLDAGSIADLVIAGDSGFSVLVASGDQFITTQYVIDELGQPGTPRRDAFDAWSTGRNDFQVLDIDVDLRIDTPEGPCCTDQLALGTRPPRDGTQAVRSKLGRPSSVIRLSTRTPILASVF
ncbi:MAG: hypothetical protein ABJD83_02355, partial [Roseobacter sp.]